MDIKQLTGAQLAQVDLHGLTVYDAEERLLEVLDNLPKEVRALAVTHGYTHGTAIKKMVKEEFYHWRVRGKQVGLNAGVTYFILK